LNVNVFVDKIRGVIFFSLLLDEHKRSARVKVFGDCNSILGLTASFDVFQFLLMVLHCLLNQLLAMSRLRYKVWF